MPNIDVSDRISIIMPVYNGERYITEALDNIVSQDYSNLELIVVNDGSTDRTPDIVTSIMSKSTMRWYMYDTNGPSAYTPMTLGYTFLNGIARCTGKYFTIHSYDNISLPGRFTKLMNIVGDHSAAYSSFMRIDGDMSNRPYGASQHMGTVGDANVNITKSAMGECVRTRVLADTAIMRKDYYMKMRAYIPLDINGGWDDELGIIMAIFSLGDIVCTDEVLYHFRVNIRNNLALDHNRRLSNLMKEHGYNMHDIIGGKYKYYIDRVKFYSDSIIGRRT